MSKLVKLHRSQNNKMIAGVMGGIAQYLGWSPTWVRVLFVIISSLSAAVPGIFDLHHIMDCYAKKAIISPILVRCSERSTHFKVTKVKNIKFKSIWVKQVLKDLE